MLSMIALLRCVLVEIFSDVELDSQTGISRHANFRNFPNAVLALFRYRRLCSGSIVFTFGSQVGGAHSYEGHVTKVKFLVRISS